MPGNGNTKSGQNSPLTLDKFLEVMLSDPMKQKFKDCPLSLLTLRKASKGLSQGLDVSITLPPKNANGSAVTLMTKQPEGQVSEKDLKLFDLQKFTASVFERNNYETLSYIFTWVDNELLNELKLEYFDLIKLEIDLIKNMFSIEILELDGGQGVKPVSLDEFMRSNSQNNTTKFLIQLVELVQKELEPNRTVGGAKRFKKTEKKVHCAGRERVVYICDRKQYVKIKDRFVSLKDARELSMMKNKN